MDDTGVSVTVVSVANASGGMVSVKRLPSPPTAVMVPPPTGTAARVLWELSRVTPTLTGFARRGKTAAPPDVAAFSLHAGSGSTMRSDAAAVAGVRPSERGMGSG